MIQLVVGSKVDARLSRLASSTTICLILLLVATEICFRAFKSNMQKAPAAVGAPAVVDETSLVRNIQKTISNKKVDPDVLVVGSSLSHCFTYDVDHEKGSTPAVEQPNCARAPFLPGILEKITGNRPEIEVMALPGAMANDIADIVESVVNGDRKAKTVIYLAAPRDFIDRRSTPKSVSMFVAAKPTKIGITQKTAVADLNVSLKDWMVTNMPTSMIRRIDQFQKNPTPQLACEAALDSCSELYEQRSQMRSALVDYSCETLNRDKDLWSAAHSQRATIKKQTRFDRDLGDYSFRYNPPDFARLKAEAQALDRLAATCRNKKIRLVIVNMPLTKENKELLDSKLHRDYKQALATAAQRHGFELIDADRKEFTRSDFIDSVHLNNYGSRKIQNLIAPQLAQAVRHAL